MKPSHFANIVQLENDWDQWCCGWPAGNKYGLCHQLTGSTIVLILFIFVHLSCQSLAGLGSEKDEEDMSYQEKKALEKKR